MGQNKQLSAVLLGSTLEFSNQLIRVLNFEFPDVRFDRQHDIASLRDIEPQPRLVVVHESAPDLEWAIRTVKAQLPGAMVAIASAGLSNFRKALSSETARSVGHVPLNTPLDVWLSILKLLLCGHTYVPVDAYGGPSESAAMRTESRTESGSGAKVCLTSREMQILPLIAQGLQNKVIAGTLNLSEHTVKLHTHNIFAKLGVSNRTAAANWYLSHVEGKELSEQIHGK